ncbi:DUF4342 domain-containing protein [Rubrivirga sp.]|uniref:DUF4342 domain-containing protein n=1 Tax=Rubrivirga sp. TaxID=1885344 RepID=UPI003C77D7C9
MSDSQPTPDPNSSTLQSEAQRLADAAKDRAGEAFTELKVASNQVVDKIRELVEDANVKRVTIQKDGKTMFEIPLTVGVGAGAAALLATPVLAAVGALAALVNDVTLVVERDTDTATDAVANAADPVATDEAGDQGKTVGKPSGE